MCYNSFINHIQSIGSFANSQNLIKNLSIILFYKFLPFLFWVHQAVKISGSWISVAALQAGNSRIFIIWNKDWSQNCYKEVIYTSLIPIQIFLLLDKYLLMILFRVAKEMLSTWQHFNKSWCPLHMRWEIFSGLYFPWVQDIVNNNTWLGTIIIIIIINLLLLSKNVNNA